ncbi:helix-turn-helix domain-containing protein [Labrys monachus]|uniref:Transcriptional regulator with XRE-family HTH domain n=1 Tax=Labrys monachus TaxID=217067 RepID=A0ABU0FPE2_9HYPH|nr:helix-turn-helix domain-containing protein [Labrys monachus]MDQ0395910.1 transcriptional regulator with XRE-family HTH domain [Labrys monachus]
MDKVTDIDADLGTRIKALRGARQLSIEALAAASGVSRAMISRIERGESSATAQLLARLAGALGVSLSTLFAEPKAEASPLARRADQPLWRDPASGYVRRAVSPATATGIVDLVEVELPAGALVPFERHAGAGFDQLVWLREGELVLSVDGKAWPLAPGDCLHMRLDRPLMFHNPGPVPARYVVVLSHARQVPPR